MQSPSKPIFLCIYRPRRGDSDSTPLVGNNNKRKQIIIRTYIAKKRLDEALAQHSRSPLADKVAFTVHFLPYQLQPSLPADDQDRWAWLRDTEFGGSEEGVATYARLMAEHHGAELALGFAGRVANTLEAHRVLYRVQQDHGPIAAGLLVDELFRRYFEDGASPSAVATLLAACVRAGVPESEAKALVVDDRGGSGLVEVQRLVRQQKINGVDTVPTIMFEGGKRDLTLVGAKNVADFTKTIQIIIKESC